MAYIVYNIAIILGENIGRAYILLDIMRYILCR
jgi:hypothetical protein